MSSLWSRSIRNDITFFGLCQSERESRTFSLFGLNVEFTFIFVDKFTTKLQTETRTLFVFCSESSERLFPADKLFKLLFIHSHSEITDTDSHIIISLSDGNNDLGAFIAELDCIGNEIPHYCLHHIHITLH